MSDAFALLGANSYSLIHITGQILVKVSQKENAMDTLMCHTSTTPLLHACFQNVQVSAMSTILLDFERKME